MVIFDPELGEESLEKEIEKILDLIKAGGGSVVEVNRWGKARLAYEIGKSKDGFYVLVDFFSEPSTVPELEETLKLNQSVLRYHTGRTWVEPPAELVKKVVAKPKKKTPAKKKAPAKRKAPAKKKTAAKKKATPQKKATGKATKAKKEKTA